MLFKISKKTETSLHKRKSFWSTFKNAYLRRKDLRKFWSTLNKKNIPPELVEITELFIKSESYNWTSKFWRHNIINHYSYINSLDNNIDPLHTILRTDYSGLTFLDEFSIDDNLKNNQSLSEFKNHYLNKYPEVINTFHEGISQQKSIDHNIALINLYEKIKSEKFKEDYEKIEKGIYKKYNPCIEIEKTLLSQHLLISLTEYYKIKKLFTIVKKKMNFLELGAGYGRTANLILSMEKNCKYVIADLPASIYFSLKNLREFFKHKKIATAFNINNQNDIRKAFDNNDVLFIFPHQLNLLDNKIFDISISIGNLCEMEKAQIKKYMEIFEKKSNFLYFKVWEISGLPYSFYQYYSIHNSQDYEIKKKWKEHFKSRCLMPNNQFDLGYEF